MTCAIEWLTCIIFPFIPFCFHSHILRQIERPMVADKIRELNFTYFHGRQVVAIDIYHLTINSDLISQNNNMSTPSRTSVNTPPSFISCRQEIPQSMKYTSEPSYADLALVRLPTPAERCSNRSDFVLQSVPVQRCMNILIPPNVAAGSVLIVVSPEGIHIQVEALNINFI